MLIFLVMRVAQHLINTVGLFILNVGGEPGTLLAATQKTLSREVKQSQAVVTPALSAAPCFQR